MKAKSIGISRAMILTDSGYMAENHKFASVWRKSCWKSRYGRPVENRELWRRFLSVRSRVPVRVD